MGSFPETSIENKDQLKGVKKGTDQLWASVLPRSPLRESRQYFLKTQRKPRAQACLNRSVIGQSGKYH